MYALRQTIALERVQLWREPAGYRSADLYSSSAVPGASQVPVTTASFRVGYICGN